MWFLIPAAFVVVLIFDTKPSGKRGKGLYLALGITAVILGVFAGGSAGRDHVGASLSGMISIFMR